MLCIFPLLQTTPPLLPGDQLGLWLPGVSPSLSMTELSTSQPICSVPDSENWETLCWSWNISWTVLNSCLFSCRHFSTFNFIQIPSILQSPKYFSLISSPEGIFLFWIHSLFLSSGLYHLSLEQTSSWQTLVQVDLLLTVGIYTIGRMSILIDSWPCPTGFCFVSFLHF